MSCQIPHWINSDVLLYWLGTNWSLNLPVSTNDCVGLNAHCLCTDEGMAAVSTDNCMIPFHGVGVVATTSPVMQVSKELVPFPLRPYKFMKTNCSRRDSCYTPICNARNVVRWNSEFSCLPWWRFLVHPGSVKIGIFGVIARFSVFIDLVLTKSGLILSGKTEGDYIIKDPWTWVALVSGTKWFRVIRVIA